MLEPWPRLPTVLVLLALPRLRRYVRDSRLVGLQTLLDYPRLAILSAAVRATRHLSEDVLECGTYRGGSAGLIGQCIAGSRRTLHVCDTFRGLPAPGELDNFHKEGDFKDTSSSAVTSGLSALGVPFKMHVGAFEKTLSRLDATEFSLAHIDVDLHDSVLECLRFVYPRLREGGVIILDDYGSPTCLGARAAADEFFSDKVEHPQRFANTAYGIVKGRADAGAAAFIQRQAGWIFSFEPTRRLAFG
jgi:O-methyltransferase